MFQGLSMQQRLMLLLVSAENDPLQLRPNPENLISKVRAEYRGHSNPSLYSERNFTDWMYAHDNKVVLTWSLRDIYSVRPKLIWLIKDEEHCKYWTYSIVTVWLTFPALSTSWVNLRSLKVKLRIRRRRKQSTLVTGNIYRQRLLQCIMVMSSAFFSLFLRDFPSSVECVCGNRLFGMMQMTQHFAVAMFILGHLISV